MFMNDEDMYFCYWSVDVDTKEDYYFQSENYMEIGTTFVKDGHTYKIVDMSVEYFWSCDKM